MEKRQKNTGNSTSDNRAYHFYCTIRTGIHVFQAAAVQCQSKRKRRRRKNWNHRSTLRPQGLNHSFSLRRQQQCSVRARGRRGGGKIKQSEHSMATRPESLLFLAQAAAVQCQSKRKRRRRSSRNSYNSSHTRGQRKGPLQCLWMWRRSSLGAWDFILLHLQGIAYKKLSVFFLFTSDLMPLGMRVIFRAYARGGGARRV